MNYKAEKALNFTADGLGAALVIVTLPLAVALAILCAPFMATGWILRKCAPDFMHRMMG